MNDFCCVGVDVSGDTLDVYVDSVSVFSQYPNTPNGCQELAQTLVPLKPHRVVFEPTGGYEKALLQALLEADLPAVRVNAERVHAFRKAQGERAKSDPLDAKLLAEFGQCMMTRLTQLPSQELQALQELRRYRDSLVEDATACKHLLRTASPTTQGHLKRHLSQLQALRVEVEKDLRAQVKAHPSIHTQVKLLCTVPGIGFTSAVAVLTELPELGTLSGKKIAALAGLAPYVQSSGKWVGQARLSGGRSRARKALYMPALVAMRYNPVLKVFYERLKGAGKPAKKALAACMRKMLCQLNAMIRDQLPWMPPAVS